MRVLSIGYLLLVGALGCQAPVAFGADGEPIFRQAAVSDIACGPSALYNWMSHGNNDLRGVLSTLTAQRTPVETVEHLIETYGERRSVTNPSVVRYGRHNGGVGSVNLMLMARELLEDHLETPPRLHGDYLQRREQETTRAHLERVAGWFRGSVDDGLPVLLYLRRYERTADRRRPRMVFGHHVAVTSVDAAVTTTGDGQLGVGFRFVDSATGRAEVGRLIVANAEFTAPTFDYRFDGERALTTESVVTGRPLLEVDAPSYESGRSREREILLAHFATYAVAGD